MQTETYYDILEISVDATPREIKKAYFKQVRLHSPDREPEVFKKIRQAYDILSDKEARKEYDERGNWPRWLSTAMETADYYREIGKTKKAIAMYEEILEKYKRIKFIEISLGQAYWENGNIEKAIRMYESILEKDKEKDKDDILIMKELAYAYSERGWTIKAINLCKIILEKTTEDIEVIYQIMLNIYIVKEKYIKAKAIAVKILEFDDIDTLWVYSAILASEYHVNYAKDADKRDYAEMQKYCILMIEILTKDEMKLYEAFDFIITMTSKAFSYDEASDLLDNLMLEVNDEDLIERYDKLKMEALIGKRIDDLFDDYRIPVVLCDLIVDVYSTDSLSPFGSESLEQMGMKMQIIQNYDYLRSKINIIKREYNEIYYLIEDFLKEIRFEKGRAKYIKELYKNIKARDMQAEFEEREYEETADIDSYIEEPYIKEEVKVGRNDPCPCGSGKKYKKCCLNK